MTADEILTIARSAGIQLEARGDRLHVEAPAGVVTPELRAALTIAKPTLLPVLVRLAGMRTHGVDLTTGQSRPPIPVAVLGAVGGPGQCFSCGARHEHPQAYGRCQWCAIAAEVFWREFHEPAAGGAVFAADDETERTV